MGVISFQTGFRSQGVAKTFAMFYEALVDERFNLRHGYNVGGFFDPIQSDLSNPNKPFANYYQPVRYRPFFRLFRALDIPNAGRFVDIGSGKGKALLLAAEIGFQDILGIELFEELNMTARQNIHRYLKNKNPPIKIEVRTEDAAKYRFAQNDTVIFLNDPFANEVMENLCANLMVSFEQFRRKIYLIYKNNNLRKMSALDKLKGHSSYRAYEYNGNYFEVYILQ